MKRVNILAIVVILTGVLLITISTFMLINKKDDEEIPNDTNYKIDGDNHINDSDALKKEKTFEGLSIEEIKFIYDSTKDESNISFKITNKSGKSFKEKTVLLGFINKNGEELNTMFVSIPDLEKNQSEVVTGSISGNIVDAYDMTIEAWED